jgi:hypothetical protein
MIPNEDNDVEFNGGQNEIQQRYETQQVSPDLFGEAEQENTGGENNDAPVKGPVKKSFAELRKNKSIPRLKKNQILAGLLVFVIGFLLLFNLLLGKKGKSERKGFSGGTGPVVYNAEFNLGDMPERAAAARNVEDLLAEDLSAIEASGRFRSPPSYENIEPKSVQQEQNVRTQNAGNYRTGYSESEAQAVTASIRKDGGYGQSHAELNQNYQPAQMSSNIPSKEDYTRQQFDNYTHLIQAANGSVSGAKQAENKNNGRYSEAGSYNPGNNDAGKFMFLDDNVIVPGTIIHAVLVSRIDTDYPGPIHARVTENGYDSKTGKNLLIPQGTILQGNYSSSSIGVA